MAAARSRQDRFELVDGPLPPRDHERRQAPRRLLLGLGLGAALVVSMIAVSRPGSDDHASPEVPSEAPTSEASTPSTGCDLTQETCRIVEAARWRDRTATILRERLDPGGDYFTGYSYSPGAPYATGTRLDALGLEIYRLEDGGTEVFIQVAKTPAAAVRCGSISQHPCTSQRFMDGNRFSLTTTTTAAQGIEVQYNPTGTFVITLIARNTTEGRPLPLGTGDLIAVAEDPRLQPPPG